MKYIIIYLNKEKTCYQLCKPSKHYKGSSAQLAFDMTNGGCHFGFSANW